MPDNGVLTVSYFKKNDMSANTEQAAELPRVLVGPVLRHAQNDRLLLWLVTTGRTRWRFCLRNADVTLVERDIREHEQTELVIGTNAVIQMLEVHADQPWPCDSVLHYDIGYEENGSKWVTDWAPHLCHEGHGSPHLVIHSRVQRILHGSCRKPHHASDDGLCRVDQEIQLCGLTPENRPSLLLMTGDQVYVDDVAGPMLNAIHQLSLILGLFDEDISNATVDSGHSLVRHRDTYYGRSRLLPLTRDNIRVIDRFFGGARKPIFTAANAENHLVTFSEVLAMYMLVWSPVPWTLFDTVEPPLSRKSLLKRYRKERKRITKFVDGLPGAARALCHVPSYMIFDDHDITDDWNLTLSWERTAYGHPFSRRIVGNALMAYALCQAWGNGSGQLSGFMDEFQRLSSDARARQNRLSTPLQDALIDNLLGFRGWQYTLEKDPAIVVLDTRTHRWHRRGKPSKPSGLMDWEALTDFQQCIMGRAAVIVVVPAPVFGVKLIEIVQAVFTFFGKPLLVDAENWMAHHEAATVMLSIFEHSQTPETFVLLSGDVHYSFVYDVRLRYQTETPSIWQITSSGLKNEFPVLLIEWLDRMNRWMFAPWSPLNYLTQRNMFRIWPRLPEGRSAGERLWNHSGVGDVRLDEHGHPVRIMQLNSSDGGTEFKIRGSEG